MKSVPPTVAAGKLCTRSSFTAMRDSVKRVCGSFGKHWQIHQRNLSCHLEFWIPLNKKQDAKPLARGLEVPVKADSVEEPVVIYGKGPHLDQLPQQ